MVLLKSTGYSKDYWNGKKYVEFLNNEYNATEDEAAFLLKCHGVYLPKEEVKAPAPPALEESKAKEKKPAAVKAKASTSKEKADPSPSVTVETPTVSVSDSSATEAPATNG